MRFALILALVLLVRICPAQTTAPDLTAPAPVAEPPKPAPKLNHAAMTAAELQKAFDQLTQSNRDLLDLLKKQQSVLEDMQYDRRLESRQIQSLEERLEETLQENSKLQNKVATLEAAAAAPPPAAQTPSTPTPAANTGATNAPVATDTTPAPPETYLPAPDSEGAPGTMSWHRLFTLKGSANHRSVHRGGPDVARALAQSGPGGKGLPKHERSLHQCLSQERHHAVEGLLQTGLRRRQDGAGWPRHLLLESGSFRRKLGTRGGRLSLTFKDRS
jgi:hypothetical protein